MIDDSTELQLDLQIYKRPLKNFRICYVQLNKDVSSDNVIILDCRKIKGNCFLII